MKKLLMIVAVACAALCTSCTTVADRAKRYAEEVMDAYYEDKARMKTLAAEIVEYANILSDEDKNEFIAVLDKTAADADFNDMFLAVNALYFSNSLVANADNAQALTPIFDNINVFRKILVDKSIVDFIKQSHEQSHATTVEGDSSDTACFYVCDKEHNRLVFTSNNNTRHVQQMLEKALAVDHQFQFFLDYYLMEDGYSYEDLLVKSVNASGDATSGATAQTSAEQTATK
jgi:hypothetical protein